MKIDVTQQVIDRTGKTQGVLRDACVSVCDSILRGDEALSGEARRHLGKLADQISIEDTPDLPIEDWARIKERIERAPYAHGIVLRLSELLDPPTQIKAVSEA